MPSPNYCLMFAKVWQRCRRQFVDSGYYVDYGAENKLENNYSHQHVAVMRRAQYGTVDALDYSRQVWNCGRIGLFAPSMELWTH